MTKAIPLRIACKIAVPDDNGCWRWTGSHAGRDGRPYVSVDGKARLAYRVIWELLYGEKLGRHEFLCHRCDVPDCVNPEHLFKGSQSDNMADAASKGRMPRGESHYRAKLTDAQVIEIRASDERNRSLARRFKVDDSTISQIRSGKRRGG